MPEAPRVAILLFTRPEDDTSAKSRLRAELSDTIVQKLHRAFVMDSIALISNESSAQAYIAWSRPREMPCSMPDDSRNILEFVQQGENFGERFQHAITTPLLGSKKCRGVIIIGSDTPYIMNTHLEQARRAILENRSVIGRSQKNGFYLLGIPSETLSELNFSQDFTVPNTEADIISNRLQHTDLQTLPKLRDIDSPTDYRNLVSDYSGGRCCFGPALTQALSEIVEQDKLRINYQRRSTRYFF